MDASKEPGIRIAQVFLERAEFSHREDFLDLPPNAPLGEPVITLTVHSGESPDGKRGLIRVQVQSKPEQRPLYVFDVVMTAIVEVLEGHENMPMTQYVRTSGPAMVYTFVRQMVADLTWRGRFGPLWLSPVNIVAMTDQPPRGKREDTVLYGPTAKASKVRPKIGKPATAKRPAKPMKKP